MSTVKVLDMEFVPFLTREQIQEKVSVLGQKLNTDYYGKKPLFLAILNGAFVFAADLFREINIEAEITFIKVSSYSGTESTGKVTTCIGLNKDIAGRDVIIVEDIIDTGRTLSAFIPELKKQHPSSVKLVTLLNKKEARLTDLEPDYCAFEIPNKFVVGYGLDYDGYGRNLPEIMQHL